jgi:superfamily II DNA/RNA helicase
MSGTMSNAKDIAVWVKSLNGKATKLIRSPWKPHSVDVVYHEVDSYHSKLSVSVGVITDIAKESKVIVFVHSKATGKELQKMLSKKKIRNVFHHSSVSAKNRTLMEEAFSNNDSLRVLISTSTLGAGVNIL